MRRLLIACSLVVACAGPNYYDVLGVGPRATTDQIRAAWKAAALRHHPDKNPKDPEGAAERTKRINTAKDVLCDPDKRRAHDAELRAPRVAASGSRGAFTPPEERFGVRRSMHRFYCSLEELGGFRPFPKLVAAPIWVPHPLYGERFQTPFSARSQLWIRPGARAGERFEREFGLYGRRYVVDFELAEAPHARFRRCLLYTSPSPRDRTRSRMPSSA